MDLSPAQAAQFAEEGTEARDQLRTQGGAGGASSLPGSWAGEGAAVSDLGTPQQTSREVHGSLEVMGAKVVFLGTAGA